MASMSAVKNAILKSPEMAQSLPLRPAVSRVCFASATRHQQGRNMAGEAGRREYSPYNADDSAADEVKETMESARSAAQHMNEKSKEKLGPMADKTADAATDMADKTKRQAQETSDKVRGAAETAADKTKGAAEKVADAAKGAWGAAKDTTQKIKETVVGKSDGNDLDDYNVKNPKAMDEEERRRRVDDHDRHRDKH